MDSDTGYAAIAAAIVVLILGGFFGALWFFLRYAGSERKPYPFDDPNFIHVGITPRQAEALKPIALELRFMRLIPCHENKMVDATFYAMTREEFITFFGTVTLHTRILMAEAAKEAMRNDAVILKGDAFTLSEMLIGLTEIRNRISPPLASEFSLPLKAPVDTPPMPAR